MKHAAPWLILIGVWAYVCAPLLLGDGERIFAGALSGDNIATIWFYDLLGRSLPAAPGELGDFDWPWPYGTLAEFPSVTDAAISGLVLRFRGWQAGWGWVQALALGVNALGAAALARAAGARAAGVVAAGGMALMCRQIWFDLICARMNAAWPGFALLAMAATIALLRREQGPGARLLWVGVGAMAGANAALIYPPHLLMLAPAGVVLAAGPLWGARWRERLWALLPMVGALLWTGSELVDIAATRQIRDCTKLSCPDAYHALSVDQLTLEVRQTLGLSLPGLYWTTWLAGPLVLLGPRRWAGLGVALVGMPLLWVALGPCPAGWREGSSLDALSSVWCALGRLSDYGRAATTAAMLAAVLGGLGISALPGAPVRAVATAWLLVTTWSLLQPEYLDPHKWKTPTTPASVAFLRRVAPDEVVVELPYERSAQFISVLEAPGPPRVNPLKLEPRFEDASLPWSWLHAIGRGRAAPEGEVSRADLAALQIQWILYEPERCSGMGARCREDDVERLRAVLGDPQVEEGGRLLVWPLP